MDVASRKQITAQKAPEPKQMTDKKTLAVQTKDNKSKVSKLPERLNGSNMKWKGKKIVNDMVLQTC